MAVRRYVWAPTHQTMEFHRHPDDEYHMKLTSSIALGTLGVLLLTGCGDGEPEDVVEESRIPFEERTREPTPVPATEGLAASRCVEVPEDLLEAIAEGLDVDGGGTLRDGRAVKSNDHEEVWFIAAEIDGPGMDGDGDVGVWAKTGELDAASGGMLFAVNGLAAESSEWREDPDTEADITMSDDGASEAGACVHA